MEINISFTAPILTVGNGSQQIVFIHYFGGAAESWKWLFDELAPDYTCHAIQLPGFGQTEMLSTPTVAFYALYIQHQLKLRKIDNYILIGHSMGGKIALQVALQEKAYNRLHELILVAPSPPSIEGMSLIEKKRMIHHPNQLEEERTVKRVTVKALTDERFELAVATQHVIDANVWRWWLTQGMNQRLSEETKQLVLPVTVITSTDDPCITTEMITQEVMPNLPPHSQLITTSGIGHLYPLEDPEWLAETIRTVLIKK